MLVWRKAEWREKITAKGASKSSKDEPIRSKVTPEDFWVFDQVSQNVNLSKQDYDHSGVFHCTRGLNIVAMT